MKLEGIGPSHSGARLKILLKTLMSHVALRREDFLFFFMTPLTHHWNMTPAVAWDIKLNRAQNAVCRTMHVFTKAPVGIAHAGHPSDFRRLEIMTTLRNMSCRPHALFGFALSSLCNRRTSMAILFSSADKPGSSRDSCMHIARVTKVKAL